MLGTQVSSAQTALTDGFATHYNDKFVGKPTSSGELLDKTSFTCAHSSYPLGTLLKIENVATRAAIVVRVNDKQPKLSPYIATVTRRGAELLGMIELGGKMPAHIEVVEHTPVGKWTETSLVEPIFDMSPEPQARLTHALPPAVAIDTRQPITPIANLRKMGGTTVAAATPTPELYASYSTTTTAAPAAKASENTEFKLKMVQHSEKAVAPSGFAVQIGAMNTHEKAIELVANLNNTYKITNVLMTNKSDVTGDLYKVLVGPFQDAATAQQYRDACRQNKVECFLVDLTTMQMIP